jgi:signal transduction histidine kinase
MHMHRQIRFILILAITLLLGAGMVLLWLRPAPHEWPLFGVLLATPAIMALAASLVASRNAWWRQFGSVTVALVFTCALGAAIIFLTLLITTTLMFNSTHDAGLAIAIVLFATGVTMAFGYLVASSLSDGIAEITRAAKVVQAGDLSVRADDRGKDEIAKLAQAFNAMTAQLQHVRSQEARLDQMRRDLIAWVSHDLRTPLTSIRARVEALADGVVQEPAEVSRYLATIQNDTQALNRLIDDLFELATIDAGGLKLILEPCDLNDLISDTLETMSVVAKSKGVRLSGVVARNVGVITISPQHIQRVLNNLVSNALAHTNKGEVSVRAFRAQSQVCVEVADTGEGIAPQDVPHVFDRFYRGERARTRGSRAMGHAFGMGLGLAIARALVEAHNGSIFLESRLGAGTQVKFLLPA